MLLGARRQRRNVAIVAMVSGCELEFSILERNLTVSNQAQSELAILIPIYRDSMHYAPCSMPLIIKIKQNI